MAELNGVMPTIDLEEVSDKILNQKIREASERWGCFRVINHGVSLSLMSEMKKTVIDLFERPYELKLRNTDVLLRSGYRAPDEINPYYEALGLYDMASPQAVNTFCDQLDASADQREIMVKYAEAIDGLAKDLARRLAESYGLVETNFFRGWPSQFRINKYHFKPEAVGKLGVQLHTDSGFLTILQDDENVGGLEAMDSSLGTYFPIEPLRNTLAINLGDMAAIWSNGRLCNVKHRVQCKEATMRFSIASFLLGPMDTDLEPPSEFVDADHPRLYKPISHKGIRNIRVTMKLHDGEALKLITHEGMKKTVRDLHERPCEVKRRNTDVILGSGYKPRSELNPLYESFGLFDMSSPQDVNNFCDQLEASTNQREIMLKYAKATDGLSRDLARRLAESYGVVDTHFYRGWPSQFRMNKYNFNPETIGKSGAILHTDPGFLTILQGDEDVRGLEAMDKTSGSFFPINTLPNTLLVNLGDMATIWSNGRLYNMKHRVNCIDPKVRFSISSFLLGPIDRDLEAPAEFVDAEHPRLYKPISDGGLRKIKLSMNLHAGESLKFITMKDVNAVPKID